MNSPTLDLPTLKQQFVQEYFAPVYRAPTRVSMAEAYEIARRQYEQQHGHACPVSQRTFEREYYGK